MARMADLIGGLRSGWSERITSATCGGNVWPEGSHAGPFLSGIKFDGLSKQRK